MDLQATLREPVRMEECPSCRGTGVARVAPKARWEGLAPAPLRAVMGQVEQRLQ